MIVNLFAGWYRTLGFSGCSSHSGRRTFITGAARKITRVGGSLRGVQMWAGHAALSTTQHYIEVIMRVLGIYCTTADGGDGGAFAVMTPKPS